MATITERMASVDLKDVVVVGSAPTNVLKANGDELADYPLNPYRRRGGQECNPDVAASLGKSMGKSLGTSNYLSSAVIGSLPKGLSTTDKLKILQAVPPSPAREMLKQLPAATVTSRTPEGKRLRRQALKGAVMVFVTAGYSGKRFIFEKAKELGVRSVVLDGPNGWVQLLEKDKIIEKFVPIDFSDAETVFDRCLEALKKVEKSIGQLDGITTFCELAVPLASRLAESLGLPCNSSEAVDMARDKHKTREVLEKAGLPSPKHFRILSADDLSKAAAHVGFPAVIKPVSGAASIGVIRVDSVADLTKSYTRVVSDMKKARVVAGALVEGNADDDDSVTGDAGSWIDLVIMMEEYLDGSEVDCDLIFDDGEPYYGAVTDNWPTVEPYFNETGSNCPSILSQEAQIDLLQLSVRCVQALGFKLGVFHVECKFTSRGARLIEVNCRMGGGPVRDTNLLVWGVDLVEEHLMACAGVPVRPLIVPKPLAHLGEYSVNAPKTGTITTFDFLAKYKDDPEVLYAKQLIPVNSRCVCVKDGLPTWVCEIMITNRNVHENIKKVNQMITKISEDLNIAIV
eukprot:CAMPEP_0175085088 /NCGR_PEP_ID=MMETSP0052_2-20121109/28449_1 /TAXON_ID=51329 ORGANISM="Polytomella parva, Strain SAG 63-3" /NCGR_SAMPLE_ID=MMETSP0052_2 /ASSEMBLY_ACC=CAM_ASM_000194 /LENGTH=570 /DNA_ID=CAMNT_0016357021 /DNA_START=235 /DNA_END=1947 /DNA_ORIENTATION=+